MAAAWSSTQCSTQCTHNESGNLMEYTELYERTREATREAQRQGDAQLKAAIAAAAAVPIKRVCIFPLSFAFKKTGVEKAYWLKSSLNSDRMDIFLIVFQFFLRIAVFCLLFENRSGQITAYKANTGVALTRVVLCVWIAALCITVLPMQPRCPSLYQGSRGIILLLAFGFLWFGEVVAVFARFLYPAFDVALMISQCIFSNVLHGVPFSLHYKTRLFGSGLQIFGCLAMAARVQEAVPSVVFFSLSHFFGVALAYIADQQSRISFLKSFPHCRTNKIGEDSQIFRQQAPKRALGGFAGGFAGVSSLKCTYPPSIWTVLSSSYADSSKKDYVSEMSSTSSSTVENSVTSFPSRHQHLSCLSSSNKQTAYSSDTICSASSGLEFNVYWQFTAATRGGCDG